ncbi:hypothetical protein MANI_018965 [Metarhizium anisopliae]
MLLQGIPRSSQSTYSSTGLAVCLRHSRCSVFREALLLLIWLLLDAGAGDSLIKSTVLGSHRDVVGMPIDRMANIRHPDGSGRTLIRAAVGRVRNAALVRLFADSGANLSEADSDGCNLPHVAIRRPPEIIKILLESGKSIGLHRRDSKRRASLLSCLG